jgi:hypothetical protein
MVVITPCVNVVDFPSPGLAGSTFRHLGWRKVTWVAFFTFRQAKLIIKFKEDYFLQPPSPPFLQFAALPD